MKLGTQRSIVHLSLAMASRKLDGEGGFGGLVGSNTAQELGIAV
jgi:hypothetical protein